MCCDIRGIIKISKKSIELVDDFVDEMAVDVLMNKKDSVKVTIFSKNRPYLNVRNVRRRKNFQAGFEYIETNEFKDRLILIDGVYLYYLARSLKYNNRRKFCYVRVVDKMELMQIKRRMRICEEMQKKQVRHF